MRWDVAVRKPGADREHHIVGSIQPIEPFAIARRRIAPALRPPRIVGRRGKPCRRRMAAILVEAPIAEVADVEVTRPGMMIEQLARMRVVRSTR